MKLQKKFLIATLPHSGERVPPEAHWLSELDEITLMDDVDRYVDRLYEFGLKDLNIPYIKTEWHRYAGDLNRLPTDVDSEGVEGSSNPAGSYSRGFHWVYSTKNIKILNHPLSLKTHQSLVDLIYTPFHLEVSKLSQSLLSEGVLYHLDLHSMPSVGTNQHRDPGQVRKDVVISDSKGQSSSPFFKDLVISEFEKSGFSVNYNWPYFGGRITEQYGMPAKNHHVLQVELNRSLYMNEQTKQLNSNWNELSNKLLQILGGIKNGIAHQSSGV